jgi:hypothetical protein
MNLTDELLRSALRETGDEIQPGRVPALDLSVPRARAHASAPVRSPRFRWLTAVAAAVAVVAVIAGSVVLAGTHQGRTSSPAFAPAPVSTIPVIGAVPRYYAALTSVHGDEPICLVIHDSQTGATLATAVPPRHLNYVAVTAAANDMTFVIGAAGLRSASAGVLPGSMEFLQARFDPASNKITIIRLPIPALPMPDGIAVSPDGSELAVALTANLASGHPSSELRLYSLTTGAFKEWTAPYALDDASGEQGLSFGPGGILAFDLSPTPQLATVAPPSKLAGSRAPGRTTKKSSGAADAATPYGIWLLNTNAPAGNLLAVGRVAVPEAQPGGYVLQGPFALVDQGTAVVSVLERANAPHAGVDSRYAVLSARTGRVTRAFLPSMELDETLWWANPAGTVLVGTIPQAQGTSFVVSPLQWISGGRHEPVAGAPANWLDLAF